MWPKKESWIPLQIIYIWNAVIYEKKKTVAVTILRPEFCPVQNQRRNPYTFKVSWSVFGVRQGKCIAFLIYFKWVKGRFFADLPSDRQNLRGCVYLRQGHHGLEMFPLDLAGLSKSLTRGFTLADALVRQEGESLCKGLCEEETCL